MFCRTDEPEAMKKFFSETPEVRLSVSESNRARIAVLEPVMEELLAFPRGCGKMVFWQEVAQRLAVCYRPDSGADCLSVKRLQVIFAKWKREGWRALCLNYKPRGNEEFLPEAFIQFWKGLVLQYGVGRSVAQAHQELVRRYNAWRKGDATQAMPGFPECPPRVAGTDLPLGWSYANLKRKKFLPSKAENTAAKVGMNAARDFKAPVCVKRAVEPGMVYQFDDMWHDHVASYRGLAAPVIPLEFTCLDESSGCRVLYGVRPRRPRKDGTNEQLQGSEMAILLATLLTDVGYHRDGCVLKIENGTATVSAEQEAVLTQISGGKIRVERGAMLAGSAWDGGFAGQARGNFKHKAHLESSHSLVHNAMSHLPGYRGNNRNVPEDTQGLMKARERLYNKLEKAGLPQEVIDGLSAGECSWDEFTARYAEVIERLNRRTNHNLCDWEERRIGEFRIDTNHEWMPVTAGTSREILELVSADENLFRTRKMSPREVWNAGLPNLVKADFREAALLCRKWWVSVKVSERHTIEFKEPYDGMRLKFYARIRSAQSVISLLPGTAVWAFFNPAWRERGVLLYDETGRFLGCSIDEIERIAATDEAKIRKAIGVAEGSFRENLRSVNALMKAKRDDRRERLAANQERIDSFLEKRRSASLEDQQRRRAMLESDDDFDGVWEKERVPASLRDEEEDEDVIW